MITNRLMIIYFVVQLVAQRVGTQTIIVYEVNN